MASSSEDMHNPARVLQHDAQASWHKQTWASVTLEGLRRGLISPENIEPSGTASRETFKEQYDAIFQAYDSYGPHKGSYVAELQSKDGSFGISWISLSSLMKKKPAEPQTVNECITPQKTPNEQVKPPVESPLSTDEQAQPPGKSSLPFRESAVPFRNSKEIDSDGNEPATELSREEHPSESSSSQISRAASLQESKSAQTGVRPVFAEDRVESSSEGSSFDSTKAVSGNKLSLGQEIARVQEEFDRREMLKSMEDLEQLTGEKNKLKGTPAHLVGLPSARSQLDQAVSRLKQSVATLVKEKLQGTDISHSPDKAWIQSVTGYMSDVNPATGSTKTEASEWAYMSYRVRVNTYNYAYKLYLEGASDSTSHSHATPPALTTIPPTLAKARPAAAALALEKQRRLTLPSESCKHAPTQIETGTELRNQPRISTRTFSISIPELERIAISVQRELESYELLRLEQLFINLNVSNNATPPKHLEDLSKTLSDLERELVPIEKAVRKVKLEFLQDQMHLSSSAERAVSYSELYAGFTQIRLKSSRENLAGTGKQSKAMAYEEYRQAVYSFLTLCKYYTEAVTEVGPGA